jgi:hypothetical protein
MAATLSLLDGCHLLSLMALGIIGRITSAGTAAIVAAKIAMHILASRLRRIYIR